jgi:hypothetical protein
MWVEYHNDVPLFQDIVLDINIGREKSGEEEDISRGMLLVKELLFNDIRFTYK